MPRSRARPIISVLGTKQLPSSQYREPNTSHDLELQETIEKTIDSAPKHRDVGRGGFPQRTIFLKHGTVQNSWQWETECRNYSHRLSRSILTDCRCLCLLTGTVHSCRSFSRTVTAHSHRLARSKASGQLTTVVISCVAGARGRTSRHHNLTTSQHYSWHSLKSTEKTLTCTDMKASPTGTHRNCRGSDYSWTHTIFLNGAEHLRACPNLTVQLRVQHLQTS